jgi:hypothetical protein
VNFGALINLNIREQLYLKEGTMPNNFAVTLHDGEQKQKAMRAFRKNYKLDFIEIDDVDEWDEHKVEAKIVENIKRFHHGSWCQLCRGQKQRTVEYALRDTRKPMGVATYRAANELPEEYGEVLGGLEGLKELM